MTSQENYQQEYNMLDDFFKHFGLSWPGEIDAAVLTGDLGCESYNPHLSSIGVTVILHDEAGAQTEAEIRSLHRRTVDHYGINFETAVFRWRNLQPPWDEGLSVQPILLNLKADGRTMYGKDIIDQLPTPTKRDMWKFDMHIRRQMQKQDDLSWYQWSLRKSLRAIVAEASKYFYYKAGIAEYKPYVLGNLLSDHFPNFCYLPTMELAMYLWKRYPEPMDERLRMHMADQARNMRRHVNLALGFDRCLPELSRQWADIR